jgi:Tripartite tricarboxylate transporter family receptor
MLEDMPSFMEAGFLDCTATIVQGLYAPKGTPPQVLKKRNEALKMAVKDQEFTLELQSAQQAISRMFLRHQVAALPMFERSSDRLHPFCKTSTPAVCLRSLPRWAYQSINES